MALPFDPTKEAQVTPAMSHEPSPSHTSGRKQASTTTNAPNGSDLNKDSKRSEAAPISESKDKSVMAPPPKPPARRKRAPGPPPAPKDKRPPLPPGGPRNPYDWSWDREIMEAYLYLYDLRINYDDAAKSLGCSGRALEEHLKQVKKRATAKFEARDKAGARALRARAQGLAPPTDDDPTDEVPRKRTKPPPIPGRGRGRPRKVPETPTPEGHRSKRAASDVCGAEGDAEEGQSPSKKTKGDDGDVPAPSPPSSHMTPRRRHRKRRVVPSTPTTPAAAAAAAEEEDEGQLEGEGENPMIAAASSATTHTPSRKRVASAEIEDASPTKKIAAATAAAAIAHGAVTPVATMVEGSGVVGAQTDGSPIAAEDNEIVTVALPTLHDIMNRVVKREGGAEARMRFEGSMLGEVQDLSIRESGTNKGSMVGEVQDLTIGEGKKEKIRLGDEEEEDEDEELRMQEGMGQVEMTFE